VLAKERTACMLIHFEKWLQFLKEGKLREKNGTWIGSEGKEAHDMNHEL